MLNASLLYLQQLYEDVSSHKSSIEDTNTAGSRFMKESKIYDLKLKNYREQVTEQHPSIDASAKRSKMVNGIETVTRELKALNEEYKATLDKLLALLNQLQDDESKLREFVSTDRVRRRKVEKESEFGVLSCEGEITVLYNRESFKIFLFFL